MWLNAIVIDNFRWKEDDHIWYGFNSQSMHHQKGTMWAFSLHEKAQSRGVAKGGKWGPQPPPPPPPPPPLAKGEGACPTHIIMTHALGLQNGTESVDRLCKEHRNMTRQGTLISYGCVRCSIIVTRWEHSKKQKGCFNPAWLPQLQLYCQTMYLQADKLTTTSLKFQAEW